MISHVQIHLSSKRAGVVEVSTSEDHSSSEMETCFDEARTTQVYCLHTPFERTRRCSRVQNGYIGLETSRGAVRDGFAQWNNEGLDDPMGETNAGGWRG